MLWRKCQLHLSVNNSQLWRLKWHLNAFEGLPGKRAQVSGVYFLSMQVFGFLFSYFIVCFVKMWMLAQSLQSSETDVKHKKNSISICFPKTAKKIFEAVYHKKLDASQLKWPPHPSQLSLTIAVLNSERLQGRISNRKTYCCSLPWMTSKNSMLLFSSQFFK